jgi:hypothetical protein
MNFHINNQEKMTFKDYYEAIPDKSPRVEIRDELLRQLDMKYSTFYQKMNTETFNKLEREKIAEVLKVSVTELFPNHFND